MIGIFILNTNELSMLTQLHIILPSYKHAGYYLFIQFSLHGVLLYVHYVIPRALLFSSSRSRSTTSKNYLTYLYTGHYFIYIEVAFIRKTKGSHNSKFNQILNINLFNLCLYYFALF